MSRLHIVNGDSTADMLANIPELSGDVIVWRDVLHEGLVLPSAHPEYSTTRATFIAQMLCLVDIKASYKQQFDQVKSDFDTRARLFKAIAQYQEIVLWFEHDLYDQLQLLEVLQQMNSELITESNCYLVSINQHIETPFFHGFGNLTLAQLHQLYPNKTSITPEHRDYAQYFWSLITADNPSKIPFILKNTLAIFPYLSAAIRRYCQEFPSVENGLTRTQQNLLSCIAQPAATLPYYRYCLTKYNLDDQQQSLRYQQTLSQPASTKRIFLQMQDLEVSPFMGDLGIEKELYLLSTLTRPLIKQNSPNNGQQGYYQLTEAGLSLLNNNAHWLDYNDYDVYRGGVHITSKKTWFWCESSLQFTQSRHIS